MQRINTDSIVSLEKVRGGTVEGANQHQESWPEPLLADGDRIYLPMNLIDHSSNDLLSSFSTQIAAQVQFPENSVYLHGIGCVAAAMAKSFYVNYFGELTTNLYIATAQPPSTGKTGVSSYFTKPLLLATKELNKLHAKERSKIDRKIEAAKAEFKKNGISDDEKYELMMEIESQTEKLDKFPIYKPYFTDATPEAICNEASKQGGLFNIISDEAQSILTSIGLAYGDGKRAPNNEPILKGWDNGFVSMVRVSREMPAFEIRGGIAVLAQYETVRAILEMSGRENGLTERFLFGYEPHRLGTRDHSKYEPVDESVKAKYSKLIHQLTFADKTVLSLTKDSLEFLVSKKNEFEPLMADGQRYSSNLMRGFVGKMDKQTVKIAAVIHAVENFENGINDTVISHRSIERAFNIYSELLKVFVGAADSEGYGGIESQISVIVGSFKNLIEKKGRNKIKLRNLADNVKKTAPFKSQTKLMNHIKNNLMPVLQARNICWFDDSAESIIKINPKVA